MSERPDSISYGTMLDLIGYFSPTKAWVWFYRTSKMRGKKRSPVTSVRQEFGDRHRPWLDYKLILCGFLHWAGLQAPNRA